MGIVLKFATHQHVKPSQWLTLAGKAIGRSDSINHVNTELDLLRKKVYDYKDRLRIEERELGMTVNASGKMIKNLKKIVRDCVEKDWLDKDPFWRYKVKHIDPRVPHLSAEELKRIEVKEISVHRLDLVRDMFLFSCYTGFAYIDVANLTTDHIGIGVDGKKWLMKNRQKTDITEHVPILPPTERILKKYGCTEKLNGDKLLPVPSNCNQLVAEYLSLLIEMGNSFFHNQYLSDKIEKEDLSFSPLYIT
jgi:hypothetical protein